MTFASNLKTMALLLKIPASLRIPVSHSLEPTRPARSRYYRVRSSGLWEAQEPAERPSHVLFSDVHAPVHTSGITPTVGLKSYTP